MNKKTKVAIIGIIALVLVTIGITYAYWLITRTQQGENVITTGCLDIALSGSGDITLSNQFPMSDEDGMKLTPYTFTVTNNCNTSVDYQIALEATGDESTAIASSAIKVVLNDNEGLYSSYAEVDATISGAYEARRLGFSRLSAKGTEGSIVSYELRIWIDENAPISEMNKTFKSKIAVTVGQGVENVFEEDTLAYNILSNYGGTGIMQPVDNESSDKVIGIQKLYLEGFSYQFGTEYTYDNESNSYILGGNTLDTTLEECRAETVTCGKYMKIEDGSPSVLEIVDFHAGEDYITVKEIRHLSEFNSVTLAGESGVYKTNDDLGDSYYFRGAPTDNYVKFGTYAQDTTLELADYDDWESKSVEVKAGTPMYWRIVRVNGDGSIRLIYDGTDLIANGVAHTASIKSTDYNTFDITTSFAGYTNNVDGVEKDSLVKGVVDAWYEANLKVNYEKYIADGIFCNDRSILSTDEEGNIYYESSDRISNNMNPKLTCTNKSDRYTKEDITNGNGLLTNPVGLLTADEAIFAGANKIGNSNHYLYSGEYFWTATPRSFSGRDGTYVSCVENDGSLGGLMIATDAFGYATRPVINLKADVQFTGNGTIDSPYEIVME